MKILAIETSCDETSIAILENKKIIYHKIISQINNHAENKGIIPELAARLHFENFHLLFSKKIIEFQIKQIDVITYTAYPGLPGALIIGKIIAETIGLLLDKPIFPINHLLGHVFSVTAQDNYEYPAISLVVSGGHTNIYYLENSQKIKLLAKTTDDAIGECFDKIGAKLGFNYPAGPIIDQLAQNYKDDLLSFPNLNLNNQDFSFSGIKSHFIRHINKGENKEKIAASAQICIINYLLKKLEKYLDSNSVKSFSISGGVSNNSYLIEQARKIAIKRNKKILIPSKELRTDNAAMIGLAYLNIANNLDKNK